MDDKKPIVTQWFRGQLEGHYVGTLAGGAAVSQFGMASRYKLRIYRALIRKIEILESVNDAKDLSTSQDEPESSPDSWPQPPVELPNDCFYQAQIEDARLLGIHPRSCFEGTVYDVAVSQLRVTHTTKKGGKTYGRLVGEVYGRFLLPEADPKEAVVVVEELLAVHEPVVAGAEQPLAATGARAPAPTVAKAKADARDIEPLHPPAPPSEDQPHSPGHVPVTLLVVLMAIVLGLGGGPRPALFWLGLFIPILVIRLAVGGLYKVTAGQRVFGAILIFVQVVCLGLIMLDWWLAGCKAMDPWALAGVGITVLLASPLPSPAPLVCTGGGLALVLFLWYGSVGIACHPPKTVPVIERPAEPPTVDDPGVPRTNDDGSWPRRPPRGSRDTK